MKMYNFHNKFKRMGKKWFFLYFANVYNNDKVFLPKTVELLFFSSSICSINSKAVYRENIFSYSVVVEKLLCSKFSAEKYRTRVSSTVRVRSNFLLLFFCVIFDLCSSSDLNVAACCAHFGILKDRSTVANLRISLEASTMSLLWF